MEHNQSPTKIIEQQKNSRKLSFPQFSEESGILEREETIHGPTGLDVSLKQKDLSQRHIKDRVAPKSKMF